MDYYFAKMTPEPRSTFDAVLRRELLARRPLLLGDVLLLKLNLLIKEFFFARSLLSTALGEWPLEVRL